MLLLKLLYAVSKLTLSSACLKIYISKDSGSQLQHTEGLVLEKCISNIGLQWGAVTSWSAMPGEGFTRGEELAELP